MSIISVCLFQCVCIYLSVCLSVYLSVCKSLSGCLSACPPILLQAKKCNFPLVQLKMTHQYMKASVYCPMQCINRSLVFSADSLHWPSLSLKYVDPSRLILFLCVRIRLCPWSLSSNTHICIRIALDTLSFHSPFGLYVIVVASRLCVFI